MLFDDNKIYDFGLVIPKKYTNDIFLFNDSVPPTVDEGINGTFPEKIRRFNTSAAYLIDSIKMAESSFDNIPIIQLCSDIGTPYDAIYRKMIRSLYFELFVYQEKLLNIVCNLFFIKISSNRVANLKKIQHLCKYFPNLKAFYDKCITLSNDEQYKNVMSIRDNEVHNMSQIDSFIYDLEKTENGVKIISKGYKIKARELRENYLYVAEKLYETKEYVQKILDENDICWIHSTLCKNKEKVYVN